MSGFVQRVRSRAAALGRRIVFPESADLRTLEAVRFLKKEGIVRPALVLDPSQPATHAAARATGVECVDPTQWADSASLATALLEARYRKGMTADEAHRLALTPLFLADGLVRSGAADGCVAGATHTTAEILRAAMWTVGPANGVRTVSSAFYMVTPAQAAEAGVPEVITFTDCAVVPDPDSVQLAEIAVAAIADRRRIVGDEPVVAFLSYSTHGSAKGGSVGVVRAALDLARRMAPGVVMDGELQGDAALVADVAARKAADSPVRGRANILVFPSLDAANIAYKLVQRIGGATAIGPIVQGLRRPCSDLSRGATTDDIITVAAITALQSSDAATPLRAEESTA